MLTAISISELNMFSETTEMANFSEQINEKGENQKLSSFWYKYDNYPINYQYSLNKEDSTRTLDHNLALSPNDNSYEDLFDVDSEQYDDMDSHNICDYLYKVSREIQRDNTRSIFIAIFSMISVFGMCGNLLVISAVIRNKKLRSMHNMFIVNLAFSDFLLCSFTAPLTVYRYVETGNWCFGLFLCKLIPTLQIMNMFTSTFSITAIAIDRYHLIAFTQHRRNIRVIGYLGIFAVWILSTCIAIPEFQHHIITEIELKKIIDGKDCKNVKPLKTCMEIPDIQFKKAYTITLIVLQYVAPVLLVTICYTLLSRRLKRRIVLRQRPLDTSFAKPITQIDNNDNDKISSHKQSNNLENNNNSSNNIKEKEIARKSILSTHSICYKDQKHSNDFSSECSDTSNGKNKNIIDDVKSYQNSSNNDGMIKTPLSNQIHENNKKKLFSYYMAMSSIDCSSADDDYILKSPKYPYSGHLRASTSHRDLLDSTTTATAVVNYHSEGNIAVRLRSSSFSCNQRSIETDNKLLTNKPNKKKSINQATRNSFHKMKKTNNNVDANDFVSYTFDAISGLNTSASATPSPSSSVLSLNKSLLNYSKNNNHNDNEIGNNIDKCSLHQIVECSKMDNNNNNHFFGSHSYNTSRNISTRTIPRKLTMSLTVKFNSVKKFRLVSLMNRTRETKKQSLEKIRQKRMRRLLTALALVCALSWLPYHFYIIIGDFFYAKLYSVNGGLSINLIACSSAVMNPILYGILNENFRKEFHSILNVFFHLFHHCRNKRKTTNASNNNNNTIHHKTSNPFRSTLFSNNPISHNGNNVNNNPNNLDTKSTHFQLLLTTATDPLIATSQI
ncbi:hypothetical protein SNEBB_005908 [Seison nebaliae]|nr:hypothetical protein SNEBB_005908 [Seison nebaliae]